MSPIITVIRSRTQDLTGHEGHFLDIVITSMTNGTIESKRQVYQVYLDGSTWLVSEPGGWYSNEAAVIYWERVSTQAVLANAKIFPQEEAS